MQHEIGYSKALNKEFEISVDSHIYNAPVCHYYLSAKYWIFMGMFLIPLILEGINLVVTLVCEVSVKIMKFSNKTTEECVLMIMGYLLTFFNSAILLLLINANFRGTGIPINYFDGYFMDFNDKWFVIVAPIFITPMFIRFAIPPIIIMVKWFLKKLLIILDRRAIRPSKQGIFTSQNSNLDFANLYSGDEFELSNPYNKVLLNVMVSMMLGFGLPILFPLVLIFIIVIYFSYKVALLYWFQKPPQFDDSLSKLFMYNLKYGAVLYCGFAYWMLCNRQMFENYVLPKDYQDQVEDHGHTLFYNPSNHTYILLVMFFVIIAFLLFYEIFYDCFNVFFETSMKRELQHLEGLYNFYSSISNKNLEMWISEERMIRNQYDYKIIFDETYNRLLQEKTMRNINQKYSQKILMDKGLFDDSSYYIMTIPYYYEQVGYIPVIERNQTNYRKQDIAIINDTRRIFDYPYFAGSDALVNLFKNEHILSAKDKGLQDKSNLESNKTDGNQNNQINKDRHYETP